MENLKVQIFGPFTADDDRINQLIDYIFQIDKEKTLSLHKNKEESERAVLVGLESDPKNKINGMSYGERSLDELEELATTAGAVVLEKILSKTKEGSGFLCREGKLKKSGLYAVLMQIYLF